MRSTVCAIAFVLGLTGCAAGTQSTPTPAREPTAAPTPEHTPSQTVEPTPVPTLGAPWSPATSADTALADRVLEIWTDGEVEALDEVYDEAVLLVIGWGEVQAIDDIRAYIPGTPNTYTRVSGVTVTTTSVPGLWSLPAGSRFLHLVARIHGDLFDVIFQVNQADKVVVHYAYEYEEPSVRARDGFPSVPTPAPSAS